MGSTVSLSHLTDWTLAAVNLAAAMFLFLTAGLRMRRTLAAEHRVYDAERRINDLHTKCVQERLQVMNERIAITLLLAQLTPEMYEYMPEFPPKDNQNGG